MIPRSATSAKEAAATPRPWLWALLIYFASRVWFGVWFVAMAPLNTADRSGREAVAKFDYFTMATNWDGDWYRYIVSSGYPDPTLNAAGGFEKSELAFYPLWAWLLRAGTDLTNLPFYVVASALALLLGAAGMLVLYKLFSHLYSPPTALLMVTATSFVPISAVFSMAYTESLALLLVTGTLYLLVTKRYGLALLPLTLLAFARPILLPFAALLGAYGLYRRYKTKDIDAKEQAKLYGLALYSGLAYLLWPAYCWYRTGDVFAYFTIQEAWRKYGTDRMWIPNLFQVPDSWPIWVCGLALVLFMGAVAWLNRPHFTQDDNGRVLVFMWSVLYLLYVGFTIQAGTTAFGREFASPSILRYLLLAMLPLAPVSLLGARKKAGTVALGITALAFMALTPFYIYYFVVYQPPTLYFWP